MFSHCFHFFADQQSSQDSLSHKLSDSLGLEGDDAGDELTTQPLPFETVQSEIEAQPQPDNNLNRSTMDTHNITNQLASSMSQLSTSPSTETFPSCSHNHQILSSSSSLSSPVSASSSPLCCPNTTHIFDAEYPMDRPRRGLCVIFNHEHFDYVNRRKGTDFDAYRLENCFASLGFTIETHKDLHADDLKKVLTEVSAANHSDADCFVCCFLTHGDEESLYAKDNTYYKRDVFDLFTGEKCPSLKGKPKVFIIQACRGTKTDPGVSLEYQTDAAHRIAEPINRSQTIPIWADFLISYSTVEGYYSYRNTSSGGPFVQSLVPHLEKYGAHYDLVSILTRVNQEVGIYEAQHDWRPIGKQIPQIVQTLTKKLIFRRKPNQKVIPSTLSYRDESFNQINLRGASNYPEED